MLTPRPRELELLDGPETPLARLEIRREPGEGEAYTLEVAGGVATLAGAVHLAEQTLRQLGPSVPPLRIRDFPAYGTRGIIEGFYGRPWSHRERLDLLAFCGRHKLNTFVYAPKDDPYHRDGWRDPYPRTELGRLAELVEEARRRHVDFAWAVAPGLSIRHGDEADLRALCTKAEQLWEIGVRHFQLLWDDIEDASAEAQAEVSNRFAAWLPESAAPLVVCPVEYHGTASTPYRDAFARTLDPAIVVYWTGPEVVPPAITRQQAGAAREAFAGHELLLWDNYPVNDFEPSRLFLGPLVGRAPGLPVRGAVANGMIQAAPSKLGFATAADWMWNPEAYEPERSLEAAVRALGGEAADALAVFAAANGHEPRGEEAEVAGAAQTLVRELDDPWFLQAAGPWLDAAVDRSVPRYARIPALADEHEPLPARGDVLFVASKEQGVEARGTELPVVAWDGLVELGLADSAGHVFLDYAITIVEPGHPLAAGREGVTRVYRGPGRLRFGRVGPEAVVVAVAGKPPRPVLFGYERGAALPGGGVAPARRVGLFLAPEALDPWLLAPTGRALFDAAVEWAAG
jgi:hypothetical protein